MTRFTYPFLRKRLVPGISKRGKLPSEYCHEAGEWVHFPVHCKEIQCPRLLHVERYGVVCEDHYEWEVGVVKATARSGVEPVGYEWDILRDISMTDRYSHLTLARKIQQQERLADFYMNGAPAVALTGQGEIGDKTASRRAKGRPERRPNLLK